MANKSGSTPTTKYPNLAAGKTLTDAQILELYKKYGLQNRLRNASDYAWVRKNFGNNPATIEKVLQAEKAKLTPPPTKTTGAAGAPGVKPPVDEASYAASVANKNAQQKSTPGGKYLVKFSGDPNAGAEGSASTIWLEDSTTGVLRPIMNEQALRDMYPNQDDYNSAIASINIYDPKDLLPGGQLGDYMLLDSDYGVYPGGKTKKLSFTPRNIKNRYGQIASEDKTVYSAAAINRALAVLKALPGSELDAAFIDKISKDPLIVSGYMGALGYGNYTIEDIYRDLKRRQLADAGNKSMANLVVIDPNLTKEKFAKTTEGSLARASSELMPPQAIAGYDFFQKNIEDIAKTPDDFFNTLDVAKLMDNLIKAGSGFTEEFKQKLEEQKSILHDSILDVITADTKTAKMLADENWKKVKTEAEKALNITLNDNALTAWNQIESMVGDAARSGLGRSGILSEKIDEYLARARELNKRAIESSKLSTEEKEAANLKNNASPEEIKRMNDEDAAKGLPRTEWRAYKLGLTPAQEVTKEQYLADVRSKYKDNPSIQNMSDEEIIDRYYNQRYDQYGNYRSEIYKTAARNEHSVKYGTASLFDQIPGSSLYEHKMTEATKYFMKKAEELAKQFDEKSSYEEISDPKNLDLKNEGRLPSGAGDKLPGDQDTKTPQDTTTPGTTQKWAPPSGTEKILTPNDIKNYTNVVKDPYSNAMYGIKKAPAKATTTKWTPPAGTQKIMTPGDIKNYTNVVKDPYSNAMYGTPRKAAASSITPPSSGLMSSITNTVGKTPLGQAVQKALQKNPIQPVTPSKATSTQPVVPKPQTGAGLYKPTAPAGTTNLVSKNPAVNPTGQTSAVKKATLYDPTGKQKPKVVTVGSTEASGLMKSGWKLNK